MPQFKANSRINSVSVAVISFPVVHAGLVQSVLRAVWSTVAG
jgi:hypothetical protein